MEGEGSAVRRDKPWGMGSVGNGVGLDLTNFLSSGCSEEIVNSRPTPFSLLLRP